MRKTNRVDTVTPVVSEDESLKQQKQQTPNAQNDRLQVYLNNLSSAETPPSKHKYTSTAKKSHSHEKQSNTLAQKDQDQDQIDQVQEKGKFFLILYIICCIFHIFHLFRFNFYSREAT